MYNLLKNKIMQKNETEETLKDWALDIGGFDVADIDVTAFYFNPSLDAETESRYIKPKLVPMRNSQVCYEHAKELVNAIGIIKDGDRYDCIVAGSFIFGDFLEGYLVENCIGVKELTISTLSMSQENIDSLHTLLTKHYVDKLNLLISDYFFSHERNSLIPYIYQQLDIDDKFQLSVASVHTKTIHFETEDGTKVVVHGSANLRSSGNVEQFTIEANSELYDFYNNVFSPLIENYQTIKKSVRSKKQWNIMMNKKK